MSSPGMQPDDEGWPRDDPSGEVAVPLPGEWPGEAEPQPADPATGHATVDEAVALLTDLDSLPTAGHATLYEDVHRRLHGALTELDSE